MIESDRWAYRSISQQKDENAFSSQNDQNANMITEAWSMSIVEPLYELTFKINGPKSWKKWVSVSKSLFLTIFPFSRSKWAPNQFNIFPWHVLTMMKPYMQKNHKPTGLTWKHVFMKSYPNRVLMHSMCSSWLVDLIYTFTYKFAFSNCIEFIKTRWNLIFSLKLRNFHFYLVKNWL